MHNSETHILKFGGSSLQDAEFIKQAIQIVKDRFQTVHPVIVVSAVKDVTDTLLTLANNTDTDISEINKQVDELRQKHLDIFNELIEDNNPQKTQLIQLFDGLKKDLIDFKNGDDIHQYARKDRILSIGERASALIFAAALSEQKVPSESFEAQQFVKTDSTFGQANVQPDATRSLIQKYLKQADVVPVVTGFIGSDSKERITTLGRSGSDYTAGLVTDALDANHLEIWTDVDGVLSADPRWVPTAKSIEELSFGDITTLSAHGAKVIHPKTIRPINDTNTTVRVKNSYDPSHPGTLIKSGYNSNGSLKTITVTGPFVRLQIDEQHTYELLDKVNKWQQGYTNSEAVGFHRTSGFEPARFLFRKSFFNQIDDKLAKWATKENVVLDLGTDLYKVKKFSNHFAKSEKLSNKVLELLAANNLKPVSTNRNHDERFISFLFKKDDAQLAARLMNDYLQGDQTVVDLFVAGTGAVGQTLLDQLKGLEPDGLQFRLLGACNSRNALWNDDGLILNSDLDWSKSEKTDWDLLTKKLTRSHHHNLIFVDATGSEEVARLYPQLLENNIHIVTPSKLANTFEQSFFDKLQSLVNKKEATFRYETTVGAGLPAISTIENLQSSGDQIKEISGVVSGTMTYLFNQLENGVAFSDAIVEARELGYAEPDPRDDLSGEDVARKFLTLARTLGLKIERDQLEVESLIPKDLREVDQDIFLEKLHQYDEDWQQRIRAAKEQNKTLRYTGQLKDGKISIGIQTVAKDSPLGQLKGTDNLIQIFSRLYNQTPLVIQGPGAGKKVTASGVLSDILKTAKSLT